MGNISVKTSARDIILEWEKASSGNLKGITMEQIDSIKISEGKLLDSFEKISLKDWLYEHYPNYQVKQPMPKSLFGNPFGYDMQKEIGKYMRRFYTENISQSELEEYFEKCCLSMRKHVANMRWTSGDDAADRQKIVSEIYEIFAKENARAANYANYQEGEARNATYGGREDDWVYYNSDYYYKCEEVRKILQIAVKNITSQWDIDMIDTKAIERNSGFTLDGKFDFNSLWNHTFRNQVGRASIADESIVPPENFKFFYKGDGEPERGVMWCSLNGREINREVPFFMSRGSLKGQIFSLKYLLGDFFKAGNSSQQC